MKKEVKVIIAVCIVIAIITSFITVNLTGNVVKAGGWFNKKEVYTASEVDELIESLKTGKEISTVKTEEDGEELTSDTTIGTIISEVDSTRINVQDYGAKGDGVTDDTQAIQNALDDSVAHGGGEVYLPPTGKAYVITNTIILGNGVALTGAATQSWPGESASETQWTASGTWIKVKENVVGVKLLGHGSALKGINFIHQQGAIWSPDTSNTWTISVSASNFRVENIIILNTAKGMIVEYEPCCGGGTYSYIRNLYISAYKTGLKLNRINDKLDISDLHFRNLVSASSEDVANYLLNNYIAMEVGYLDNVQVNNIEFFIPHTAILFRNGNVDFTPGNQISHSLYNGQFNNIIFNQPRFAMRVEDSSTIVTGQFDNIIAQGPENNFNSMIEDTLFMLRSDFVDLQFSNLFVPITGGAVMEIGGGGTQETSVMIDNTRIEDFSSIGTPRSAFIVYSGTLTLGSNYIESSKGYTPINSQGTVRKTSIESE